MPFLHEYGIPDHTFPPDWDELLWKYPSTTRLAPQASSSPSDPLAEDHRDPSTASNAPPLVLPPSLAHALLLLGLEDGDSQEYSGLPQQSLCNPLPLGYFDGRPFLVVSPSCYTNSGSSASSNPTVLNGLDEDAAKVTSPLPETQRASESTRGKPTRASLRLQGSTHVGSPTESDTPTLTEASTSSSPAALLAKRGKRKRGALADQEETSNDEELSAPSAIKTPNGRFSCMWSHIFGGDCEQTFAMPQEHDKHALTHIPNADGTLVTLFKCKACVQKWTEKRQSSAAKADRCGIKKTEFGMFPRKDSCLRHINSHAKASGTPASDFLLVDEAPWWWPEYIFLTGTYKAVPRQEKPEGETRSSMRFLQDVIMEHPSVVNKPHDPLHGINNGRSCYCVPDECRSSKRRRSTYG